MRVMEKTAQHMQRGGCAPASWCHHLRAFPLQEGKVPIPHHPWEPAVRRRSLATPSSNTHLEDMGSAGSRCADVTLIGAGNSSVTVIALPLASTLTSSADALYASSRLTATTVPPALDVLPDDGGRRVPKYRCMCLGAASCRLVSHMSRRRKSSR